MTAATHPVPARLGFAASAATRALVAAVFAAGVVAALVLVENLPEGPGAAPATLSIEATAPIDRWLVHVDGREAHGAASGAASWSGDLPAGAVAVTVEAHGHGAAPIALKVTLLRQGDAIEQLAWGNGTASCTLRVHGGDHHD